jgi:CHU_C Type IX secretion signal domain
MRPEFEKYSLIDNYLSGKLSEQENSAFENSMAEDHTLRQEVFDRKVVHEIIIEKRFFDITTPFRLPAHGTRALLSKSVKRFLGIGAAATVILFTPYYFSKRAEQTIEHTATSEQKTETTQATTPSVVQQEQPAQELVLEEKVTDETVVALPVEELESEVTVEKAKVAAKKKNAKSYILEIPIDDPSAKGYQANSYTFSPAKGQSWKIPMRNYKQGAITIFNKEGNEVFSATLEQGKNASWNGQSVDGIKQKAGKYAYLMDFGNGNIEHGHVTINP